MIVPNIYIYMEIKMIQTTKQTWYIGTIFALFDVHHVWRFTRAPWLPWPLPPQRVPGGQPRRPALASHSRPRCSPQGHHHGGWLLSKFFLVFFEIFLRTYHGSLSLIMVDDISLWCLVDLSLCLSIAFWKSSAKGEWKNNRSARGYDDSDL